MTLSISGRFDSGNVVVHSLDDPRDITLGIRPDAGEEHLQWFYFRVSGARGVPLRMRLTNAEKTSYPRGWEGYRACRSFDRKHWSRVTTEYENGELVIEDTPEADVAYYAYFAPYPLARHERLIAKSALNPLVSVERLGGTPDGFDLDLLCIADGAAEKKPCWIIARQHPGESMAEWLVEGLLERLLDENDPVSRQLLGLANFYIVPNMNPDGTFRGHLRCNALGTNLNRSWKDPTLERSPEVYWVRKKMMATGVKFALDVHGDEALPYNFLVGATGVAELPETVHTAREKYSQALLRANPDFQTEHGYPPVQPGKANLNIATSFLAHHFGALSMTLEQPFKDTAGTPHPDGWSPARARRLGRANLDALFAVLPEL